MDDRRVHARGRNVEVVRYDRAGKWYLEARMLPEVDDFGHILAVNVLTNHDRKKVKRQPVTAQLAAECAALLMDESTPAEVFWGLPGGRTFDRILRSLRADGVATAVDR